MLSMPPATTISESPVWMPCAARPTAFSPEPQTLLIVIAATSGSQAAAERGLPGRILAEAGGDHVAHDDFVDLLRATVRRVRRQRARQGFRVASRSET